jgi:hypothetical protein
MEWAQSPFAWMCILNVATGLFSAAAGLFKGLTDKTALPPGAQWTTANPWLYVIGGSISIVVGICNGYRLTLGTLGTIAFIGTSIYDGWFGPGSKDWRFYTLTAYILAQSGLVLWSLLHKSLWSLP